MGANLNATSPPRVDMDFSIPEIIWSTPGAKRETVVVLGIVPEVVVLDIVADNYAVEGASQVVLNVRDGDVVGSRTRVIVNRGEERWW